MWCQQGVKARAKGKMSLRYFRQSGTNSCIKKINIIYQRCDCCPLLPNFCAIFFRNLFFIFLCLCLKQDVQPKIMYEYCEKKSHIYLVYIALSHMNVKEH